MHDFLSDTDDPATATKICYEVSNILAQGCFPLRKWISNKPEILKNIINVDDENSIVAVGKGENTKTLGLCWSPTEDHLVFKVNEKYFGLNHKTINYLGNKPNLRSTRSFRTLYNFR